MKRTVNLIAILFCACISVSTFAANEKVEIRHNNDTYTETRSVANLPEASIENRILIVSFDDYGVYSLFIENDSGIIVYYSVLPADGIEYHFDLSGIGAGTYRLILDGHKGEYEGYFSINVL